jgi:hypothetical protein
LQGSKDREASDFNAGDMLCHRFQGLHFPIELKFHFSNMQRGAMLYRGITPSQKLAGMSPQRDSLQQGHKANERERSLSLSLWFMHAFSSTT